MEINFGALIQSMPTAVGIELILGVDQFGSHLHQENGGLTLEILVNYPKPIIMLDHAFSIPQKPTYFGGYPNPFSRGKIIYIRSIHFDWREPYYTSLTFTIYIVNQSFSSW